MAKLWIISELYFPEQTSTGFFLTEISKGLTSDFSVSVICGQPNYSERGTTAPKREILNGVDVHRLWSTRFGRNRTLLRIINLLTFSLSVFVFCLLNFKRDDRVLVVTNPPSVAPVVGIAAAIRRSAATLLVHDVYPEVLAVTGSLKQQSISYKTLSFLFSRSYGLFRTVVVLGRDMAEIALGKLGKVPREVEIITNWGDVNEIGPIPRDRNILRTELALGDRFTVQFSGNIGRTHDVELILHAARLLRARDDIVFMFVGEGGKADLIKSGAGEADASNLRFLPRQPRTRLNAMLAASDVTIIPFIDGMYGLSVPSRMYNIMSAAVPIIAIAHPQSELALTIRENTAGWVLNERSPQALANVIVQLATPEGRVEARTRGANARQAVEVNYTLSVVLDRYRRVLV